MLALIMFEEAETLTALAELDLEWARVQIPRQVNDDYALLVGLHKARYECRKLAAALRHESAEWLRERNFRGMHGLELLPKGQLPI